MDDNKQQLNKKSNRLQQPKTNGGRGKRKSGQTCDKDQDDLTKENKGFQAVGTLFDQFEIKENDGYITREFQDYGYRLAVELDDLAHKGLYIKMAKKENRGLLERARSFVSDANAKNKGALFMWKLKQLKKEKQSQE